MLKYPHAQAVIQASWNWPFGRKDLEVYGSTGSAITVGADKLRLRRQGETEDRTTDAALAHPNERDLAQLIPAGVLKGTIQDKGDRSLARPPM